MYCRRDLLGAAAGLGGRLLHLVFAVARVVGQVADIGHVDDVGHLEPLGAQGTHQEIREQDGAQVADVLWGVHRRAAGVDARVPRLARLEAFLLARARVVEAEAVAHREVDSRSTTARAAMPSPRPIAPRWSVLVIFTLTTPSSAPSAFATPLRMAVW